MYLVVDENETIMGSRDANSLFGIDPSWPFVPSSDGHDLPSRAR